MAPSISSHKEDSQHVLGANRGPLAASDADADYVASSGSDVSLEKSPSVRKTRVQRFKRHWGRFWCCYFLFSIIFLAIFLPIFFLVVIPAISQLVVNKSNLVLVSASILKPRPDSVLLSVQSALDLPIGLPVRIDPLSLDLFNRDLPGNNTYAKVSINGTVIKGNTILGVENQDTPLGIEQWNNFVHQVVFKKSAPLSVKGSTNAFLGALKAHVTLDKDINLSTMNSFAGFSIDDPELLLPARDDGTNLIANATLPNPSVFTLEIGTILLDLKAGSYTIGNCTLENLVLRPGNHSNPIRGIIDLHTLIQNLGEILGPEKSSLRNGYLALNATGRSVFYDGVEIPYYTNVLRTLTLTAQVALGPLIINTLHNALNPNGTNILHNLIDPNGPNNIQDILHSINDPDGSLGLDNIRDR